MNLSKYVELEVDYSAINQNNLFVDELHDFTKDSKLRFFVPDGGTFYTAGMVVTDARTGRRLVRGTDYKLRYLNPLVFAKSAQENYFLIEVTNMAVSAVLITYQAVGGEWTYPVYAFQLLVDEYPEGLGPVIHWRNILYKPDQFKPANHRHHGLEMFGFSPLVAALERVRGTMAQFDRIKFKDFYDNTLNAYNDLMNKIITSETNLINLVSNTRKQLEYQQGDFVYTDSTADQATLRRHGKWRRHLGVTLAAGGLNNSGTSLSVGAGYTNPVRLTNLYQRIDDPWGESGEIIEPSLTMTSDKYTINEGDTATITLQGVNIPAGTRIEGKFVGVDANNVKNGNLKWAAVLDAQMRATILLETVKNYRTTGNLVITVLPDYYSSSAINITMLDTSMTPTYRLYFSTDSQGTNPVSRVNEGVVVYMNVVVDNPIQGEELDINYSTGSATDADFIDPLPRTLTMPTNGIVRMRLQVKNDEVREGEEYLVPLLLPKGETNVLNYKAKAELTINDSSFMPEFNAYFSADTSGSVAITSVDEGTTCYIFARTTLPNGSKVLFQYGGTATAEDFDYRATEAIVANGIALGRIAVKADNLTEGPEILGVTCTKPDGSTLANLSIVINDTSQSPFAEILFSNVSGGSAHISRFNEGETIFINILTKNLENGAMIDINYEMDGANSQAEINAEFNEPLPTRVAITNGRAVIAATIKNDYTADGDRLFKAILPMNGAVAAATIVDTSIPIYGFRYSNNENGIGNITEVNEGGTFWLICETKGVPAGQVLNLSYYGTASDADFVNPRPSSVVMGASGNLAIRYDVKEDYTSEGTEMMGTIIRHTNVERGRQEITIRDTSLTPVLDVLLSLSQSTQTAINRINEGVSAYVHVNFTNAPANSPIKWEVEHITTNNGDFDRVAANRTVTGTGTYNDGITTIADKTTEGDETFRIKATLSLPDGRTIVASTAVITLVDTSKTELFTAIYSSSNTGTPVINRVNEGDTFFLVLTGENIPDGTQFRLNYANSGAGFAGDSDFTASINGTMMVMNGNFAVRQITVANDRLTEGDETLALRVTRLDNNMVRDVNLVIADTSREMLVTLVARRSDGSTPPNNIFNEGDSGYIEMNYSNATAGDTITCRLVTGPGNVVLADFETHSFGVEGRVSGPTGTMNWPFKLLNDRTTEGRENFVANATNLTINVNYGLNAAYYVEDTSRTTTYINNKWVQAGSNTPITSANEGTSVNVETTPIDGVAGDVYRITLAGSATNGVDYQVDTSDRVWTGGTVWWNFNLLADRTTEGNETIQATITNLTTGQVATTQTLTVLDSSKTPTFAGAVYNSMSGGSSMSSIDEGATGYIRITPINWVGGDEWTLELDSTSQANAADINYAEITQPRTIVNGLDAVWPLTPVLDETTEGGENLVLAVFLKEASPGRPRTRMGTISILINDTSRTPTFEVYYATDTAGVNRVTSTNEGVTVYLICKTTNLAVGTRVQLRHSGSTVDANDFNTPFPADINAFYDMIVGTNGIATQIFDIKNDFVEG